MYKVRQFTIIAIIYIIFNNTKKSLEILTFQHICNNDFTFASQSNLNNKKKKKKKMFTLCRSKNEFTLIVMCGM